MANNPLEEDQLIEKKGNGVKLSPTLFDLVQHEVSKILKNEKSEQINFAHIQEFASNNYSNSDSISILSNEYEQWIVNTGATNLACYCKNMFKTFKDLGRKINVHMPDGNVKTVRQCGDIHLSESFVLKDVLYVRYFKYNLLSVGKVLQDKTIGCFFYNDLCGFKDWRTNKVYAMGRLKGNLYILDSNSFNQNANQYVRKFSTKIISSVNDFDDIDV